MQWSLRHLFFCTIILGGCLIGFSNFVIEKSFRSTESEQGTTPNNFEPTKQLNDRNSKESHHGNPCMSEEAFYYIQSGKCLNNTIPKMLTGFNHGRLGNQMFFYSTLIGIAHYSKRPAYMSPIMSSYISKFFDVPTKTIDASLNKQIKWKEVHISNRDLLEPKLKEELSAPYVQLTSFIQLYKYFDNIRPIIRQHFTFYDDIVQRSKTKLKHAKNKFYAKGDPRLNVTMVGVHVRRGDYPDHEEKWRLTMPTVEFYKGAMKYFHERYEYVIFVVSTNENDTWCKTNFMDLNNEFQIHYLDGALEEDGGLDMAVLTECDHLIFGIGTFGWWAGYLGHGEVVYCSDFIRPDSSLMPMWDSDYANFVLPEWVGYSLSGVKTEWSALPRTSAWIRMWQRFVKPYINKLIW